MRYNNPMEYKILCGKSEEKLKLIKDEVIDLVITSPPYNVNLGDNKFNKNPYDLYNDNKDHQEYIKWLKNIFALIKKKLKKGGRVAINIGSGKNGRVPTESDIMHFMTKELGYIPMGTIIWNKNDVSNRCLLAGEPINTLKGYKNIEDVKIGNSVLTHKRRYKKVTNIFKNNFNGYLYEIKGYNGEKITITEGHRLMVFPFERKAWRHTPKKRVSENYSWISPENLPEEAYLAIPKYNTQYHASKKAFNKRLAIIIGEKINYYDTDFFRLLGYYIGDGSLHRAEVRIDFSKKEKEYAQDVEQICRKYNWTFYYEKRTNVTRICISSKNKLPKILKILGGEYAKGKEIYPFLFQSPFILQEQLIKGLFRTDGYINISEAAYTTISKKLAYQIRDILLRLKIGSSVEKRCQNVSYIKNRKIVSQKGYSVRIYGKHIDKLAKIMKMTLVHNKKYRHSKVKVGSHYEFYKIRDIKKKYVKDIQVYNLEVEEDNSYTGKVVYHNCSWGSWLSPSAPSFPKPFEYIMVFAKDSNKLQYEGETDLTKKEFIDWSLALWSIAPEKNMKKIGHPAVFPLALPYRLIKMLSWKNSLILDPFNGAGTTGVACKKLNRNYIGIELSQKYCDITKKRIKEVEKDIFMEKSESNSDINKMFIE